MARLMLSDEFWVKLRTIMLQHGIYHKPYLRLAVEGILYRMRVGCPWRELLAEFGSWNSIYKKFNRWSESNKLIDAYTLDNSSKIISRLIFWIRFIRYSRCRNSAHECAPSSSGISGTLLGCVYLS